MAGGTATKTSAQAMTALARMKEATAAIRQAVQNGLFPGTDPRHASLNDPAIAAAITALQALQ